VPDDERKALDLTSLEAAFVKALHASELREREQPLERLVDLLLLDAADVGLDTDGLFITLERRGAATYIAVGHVWMLTGPQEPVHVRLAFDPRGGVVAGEAYFGLSSRKSQMNHRKSLKVLIAYPDEAERRIPWAFSFQRTETGWLLRNAD
jgi:hypothetical protein